MITAKILGLKEISKNEKKSEYIVNTFQPLPVILVGLPIILFILSFIHLIFAYLLIASIAILLIFTIFYLIIYREFISAQFKGYTIKYKLIDSKHYNALIDKSKTHGFMKPIITVDTKLMKKQT